jgi:hypothetical protein
MNGLRKVALIAVLVLDLALVLYPPFTIGNGFNNRHIGHHLLFGHVGNIDFVTLAAQITIVSMIGLVVFLLTKALSSE